MNEHVHDERGGSRDQGLYAVFNARAHRSAAISIYRDREAAIWWTRPEQAGQYEVVEILSIASYQEGYLAGWRAALDEVR